MYQSIKPILYILSFIYSFVIFIRNFLYDKRFILKTKKLDGIKVISVGNITAGGTGKTPFVEFIARKLSEQGRKIAILSRGYKRKSSGMQIVSDGKNTLLDFSQAGDEPFLLAKKLKNIHIIVNTDRYSAGKFAVEKFQIEYILLDDGFQHRKLTRDIDIVVIDGKSDLDKEKVLPFGFLREPLKNLKRASLIVISKSDISSNIEKLQSQIKNITNAPQILTKYEPTALVDISNGEKISLEMLKNKNILAFCGIGDHNSFLKLLNNTGANVVEFIKFPDHYYYTESDIEKIKEKSENLDFVVTTEKDAVRLNDLIIKNSGADSELDSGSSASWKFLEISLKILNGEEKLMEYIK